MKPILLKGHSRPLTSVKFNREGDLLFSCAKDNKPMVWYADNGERLGTYNGHQGAVWDCDVSFLSTRLLTGSADRTARLWDVETGKELFEFKHDSSVRSVAFAHGEQMILTVQDNSFGQVPTIFIYNLDANQSNMPVRTMPAPEEAGKINTAAWGSLNQTIISCHDDGSLRLWDCETGKETQKAHDHTKAINSMQLSKDQSMLVTASADYTAKVYDVKTLTCLKTIKSDRPLNAAAISPLLNHVVVGGGQEAMSVTTTSAKAGHFEVDFYHLIYLDFLGSVSGHFGPVNSLAFSPDGKSYASGSEDGYIRLHHFEQSYLQTKYG